MKFSIIVPVYNVEEYIIKCLESIHNQSYKKFEVIIVNDGSPDNSDVLIKKYIKDKNNFKYYTKENGGLSDARNFGVKYVTGDYILFVDSDDYIKQDMLYKLDKVIEQKQYDLIKFNFTDLENNKELKREEEITQSKEVTIKDIINFNYFEPACSYCFNASFYKNNNFNFTVGKYHEDYGLIPLIVIQAKNIYYLNYYGYVYLKRQNSITTDNSKNEIKANDVLYFSKNNINFLNNIKNIEEKSRRMLINFYANGAISKIKTLNNKKEYIKQLKKEKIYIYLSEATIKQMIKKIVCKISYKLYIKLFLR